MWIDWWYFVIMITDTCNVDSGGPLIARDFSGEPWYQVGVRSDPKGEDCKKAKPGVYTKVEAFLPWIESKLMAWDRIYWLQGDQPKMGHTAKLATSRKSAIFLQTT